MVSPVHRRLSKKQLVGLVYVGISLFLVGWTAQMTQAQVEWFSSTNNLKLNVDQVTFRFDRTNSTGNAFVYASLENPSSLGGLRISYVTYTVYVNSTLQNPSWVSVQGSSEVAMAADNHQTSLPANGRLSLNFNTTVLSDLVSELHYFLSIHPADRRVYTEITLSLQSTFGSLLQRYCYETPNRPLATCPAPRVSISRGGGGS